ncbi:MAG TPA: restriction endonuclease, partial [Limnochorda sp.]
MGERFEEHFQWQAAPAGQAIQHPEGPPRRGSVLEGRIRALLEARGYHAVTGKIVLDHEIDVWGESPDGKVVLAECKEFYASGPATPAMVRDFFGKVYDIEQNYGEKVHLALFVSISGFTDAARSLCDRLGILALDAASLEFFEKSREELAPRYTPLEDQAVLNLRRERDRLAEELRRRELVRRLGQQIEEYRQQLETQTLPGFLVPSSASSSFWYSQLREVPFFGLGGEFVDFVSPYFPRLHFVTYLQRRLLGKKEALLPTELMSMKSGVVLVAPNAHQTPVRVQEDETSPKLAELIGRPVVTADGSALGTVADLQIAFQDGWWVRCVKVRAARNLQASLPQAEFTLPGERTSLTEASEQGWVVTAHVRF